MNPAEDYILKQQEPYRSILLHLQVVIEHTLPEAELKYKWRIPCYYIGKRPICYLNQSKDYVDVGFWASQHLSVHLEYFITEKRKVVKSLRYNSLKDIDNIILIDVLKDAYAIRDKKLYK
ncbi:DUF1801 domain-containing protein [Ichthyenterobacterium sp. W332]|uniref:DUF1801 domain-containing protein n=1 Tax=Microcosmobacter mediterraneus TaxID=3075607 RepID=A0ABU2YN05_9FLAO|nr:DUF1801 domain-containing protein [Ichthyenterobacterium sp. W332]MDT0559202.1 DUF1801 domain-containing protein [Ichthyenterobacterium sp. W332]